MKWLDVVFAQDKSRYRNRVGARNLAVIYKMALNGLMREDTLKRGMATKRCAAACNPAYREKVLNNRRKSGQLPAGPILRILKAYGQY